MQPVAVLVVTDAGVDIDDEFALILAAALQRCGLLRLLAVTANMKPSIARARLVRGTLTELGYGRDLPDIPVGMGTGMIEKRNGEPCPTGDNCTYLAPTEKLHMGDERFIELLIEAEPKSITLVLQSGLTDAAALALFHSELLRTRVREVVIMGGVATSETGGVLLENGLMVPDDANNNTFNFSAAQIFYTWCQQNNLPMIISTRHAAKAAQVPFALYDMISQHVSPIGACLRNRQYPSIQLLWKRANAPAVSEVRGPLPPNRNRTWFVDVFCGGIDPGSNVTGNDTIVPHLGKFNLYDPLNLLAAIGPIRGQYFNPTTVVVAGTPHKIIGLSPEVTGVIDGFRLAAELMELINYGLAQASLSPLATRL